MATARRFRSKPQEIRAVEFQPGMELPAGVMVEPVEGAKEHPDSYPPFKVRNQKHDSWIGVKPGDFIRVDRAPEDVYPIDAQYMREKYVELPDGS